jgi:hypothetical protein
LSISLSIARSAYRLRCPARSGPGHPPIVRFSRPLKAYCSSYRPVITVPAGRARLRHGPASQAGRCKCTGMCPYQCRVGPRADAEVSGLPGGPGILRGTGSQGLLRKGCVLSKALYEVLEVQYGNWTICWLAHARAKACNVGARSASRSTFDICVEGALMAGDRS